MGNKSAALAPVLLSTHLLCAIPGRLIFPLLSDMQPCSGGLGEARLPAQVCNLQQGQSRCTVLGLDDGTAVWATEHLLAALECCGVDNARIEVEGGTGKLMCFVAFLSVVTWPLQF